ncbi:MAG: DNA/RNA nuclease SfsA [Rhodospirillales bacterium]|jgi:sugar fermentation stimulation protein A|nr:DNA/RNA nuclease SfsA [Rhodospirillales bacterium]MDP6883626.1 DNA/RNA nuclease SfsA [Rhodospirillales bacterium]
MKFPDPLIAGTLVRRYKRFLSDVALAGGDVVTAHCANPGSMLSVDTQGSPVWLSPARNPKRKLRYTWELIEIGGSLVGINTAHPNGLAEEAVLGGAIAELSGYGNLRREVAYGRNSRIDLLLEEAGRPPCYVEVKNVTMRRGAGPDDPAEFPDSVTARGTKHLGELADRVAAGERAVMLYLVQRQDCDRLTIAGDIDPVYAEALDRAMAGGVEILCYGCNMSTDEITVDRPLALAL